jgi:hypothetical protein
VTAVWKEGRTNAEAKGEGSNFTGRLVSDKPFRKLSDAPKVNQGRIIQWIVFAFAARRKGNHEINKAAAIPAMLAAWRQSDGGSGGISNQRDFRNGLAKRKTLIQRLQLFRNAGVL